MIFQPQIIGKPLPTLTNPGTAADLLSGKQLIDANGNVLTGTMPTQGAQTITPGATAKTIAAGRYLTGAQTIQGDPDLVPENIKSGISIFGVTGSYGFKITAERVGTTSVDVNGNYIDFTVSFANEPKVVLSYYFNISFSGLNPGYGGGAVNMKVTSLEYLMSQEAETEWYGSIMHEVWSTVGILNTPNGAYSVGSQYPYQKNGKRVTFRNYTSSYTVGDPTYGQVYAIYTYS